MVDAAHSEFSESNATRDAKPARAGLTLITLILVAVVANMNLAVVNVALPEIGRDLSASQDALNLIAAGYSLGLAATVLYFGAIGDRYGRKQMLLFGMVLAIPASMLAAWAPTPEILIAARVLGGLAAGMAYPTTLALITALWGGASRVRAIALWSAIGGAASAVAALLAGGFLELFWWGSIFLVSVPLAIVALVLTLSCIPNHVHETTEPVDHFGGVMSMIAVGALVLGIHSISLPGEFTSSLIMLGFAVMAIGLFVWRQRRATVPLYNLRIAGRRIFWVAAVAGMIAFGALMGSMFIGQQYLQNVLEYSALSAGVATLPAAVCMVIVARYSATLIAKFGSRVTLMLGFAMLLAAFVVMFFLWNEHAGYWRIGLAYAFVGLGVGIAGTPASQCLTNSVPVEGVGMASGTADLERDLGGAVMQSLLGALLTVGYSAAIAAAVGSFEASTKTQVSNEVVTQLQKSYGSAVDIAHRYPEYESAIISAARTAFLDGQHWAYGVAMGSVIVGLAVVWWLFPNQARERSLLSEYHQADHASEAPPRDASNA